MDLTLLDQVKILQQKVGHYQLKHFRKLPPGSGDEKAERELFSEVDLNSEKKIKKGLESLIPNAGFFGEETGKNGVIDNKNKYWVVDPIDGTTNYLSGLDQFNISIGLIVEGTPVLGSIYRPSSGEFFCAIKGLGAWHGRKKLPKHLPMPLGSSLVGTGFPYRSPQMQNSFFKCAEEVLNLSRGIRRLGSAALDLSYVACGYLQGFWETDLMPYDVCAALVLLEETGCPYSIFTGNNYNLLEDKSLVAGLPGVYTELKEIINRHYLSEK